MLGDSSCRGFADWELGITVQLMLNRYKGWQVFVGNLIKKHPVRYYQSLERAKKMALRSLVFRLRLTIERLEREIDDL